MQPVPCVFLVSIFSAVKRAMASRVTSRSVASGGLRVAALDQHGVGAEREQRLRLRAHLGFVCGERCVGQRRGLVQVRRDQERAREEIARERV